MSARPAAAGLATGCTLPFAGFLVLRALPLAGGLLPPVGGKCTRLVSLTSLFSAVSFSFRIVRFVPGFCSLHSLALSPFLPLVPFLRVSFRIDLIAPGFRSVPTSCHASVPRGLRGALLRRGVVRPRVYHCALAVLGPALVDGTAHTTQLMS